MQVTHPGARHVQAFSRGTVQRNAETSPNDCRVGSKVSNSNGSFWRVPLVQHLEGVGLEDCPTYYRPSCCDSPKIRPPTTGRVSSRFCNAALNQFVQGSTRIRLAAHRANLLPSREKKEA
ncbi:hypothetical protein M0657_008390 [Pyricularia oryzae]|nr:hypothetical protein M9X92_008451 [Pyricularia oryzae]KAI7916797.1 hypothetical protein M0657_008390 [Pyricularia oryzae]